MRILHVTECPSWGGGAAQVLALLEGLSARGHGVELATTPGSELLERARASGLPTLAVTTRQEINPAATAKLAWRILHGRHELVHAHASHAHSLGLAATSLTGRPLVVSRRVSFRPKDNAGSRMKYTSGRVAHIVAVSQAVKRVLVQFGVPGHRISVIYSGSDPSRYDGRGGEQVRRELGIPPGAPLIGKVANLYHRWKGHDTFLEAAASVAAQSPEVRFLLVGLRTDGEKAERLISEAGLTGRVVGAGYRADIPAVLDALDISVNSPRAGEGLSGAVRESLAAGVPVVATDVGGNRELVRDGQTGLLVPPEDPGALARAIVTLLSDPDLARRLAAAGCAYVRKHLTIDRMVEEHERLYAKVLSSRRNEAGAA